MPAAERPNLKAVAARAGVSLKTASRVVNQVPTVTPDVRSRVESAIADLGYIPNASARALKAGVGRAIGIVVDSIADSFFAEFIGVVEALALEDGLELLLASSGVDPDRERHSVLRLVGSDIRGLLVAPVGDDSAYLRRVSDRLPVVVVDRLREGFDCVIVDDAGATRDAVTELTAAGHRRIAFVGLDSRFTTIRRRVEGYERALTEAGIAVDASLLPLDFREATHVRLHLRRLVEQDVDFTAVFAAHPKAAVDALVALHGLGRVDVSVMSFGSFPLADLITPPMSYVVHDPAQVATAAYRQLQRRMADPEGERVVRMLPTRVVNGETSQNERIGQEVS